MIYKYECYLFHLLFQKYNNRENEERKNRKDPNSTYILFLYPCLIICQDSRRFNRRSTLNINLKWRNFRWKLGDIYHWPFKYFLCFPQHKGNFSSRKLLIKTFFPDKANMCFKLADVDNGLWSALVRCSYWNWFLTECIRISGLTVQLLWPMTSLLTLWRQPK